MAKEATVCIIAPAVDPGHVTPHSEPFQSVERQLFVSHLKLKIFKTKWKSTK